MPLPAAQLGDCPDIETAFQPEHAQNPSARGIFAKQPARRGPAAQRVVDKPGDRGAVAGTGEAMRNSPFLQGLSSRHAHRIDGCDYLDGGGNASSGRHGFGIDLPERSGSIVDHTPTSTAIANQTHMISSTMTPANQTSDRDRTSLEVTKMPA